MIARDAAWLPHRYDPTHDAVHFVHVTRDAHRRATFLTDEYVPAQTPAILRRMEVLAAEPPAAPIHFIFHSAYCCSTLLARAMDQPGTAMGLKEPVILNDLVGWARRGGDRTQVARALDGALTLLGRPFGSGEAVVVKPSNIVASLYTAMLAMRPQARALLLYAPLPTYLGSIARKGMWGRLWVRELFAGLLRDGLIDLGFALDDYIGLTDLQIAAVGWLAQHALYHRLIARFGTDRIRTLDSETLMARQAEAVGRLGDLFGLGLTRADAEKIAGGPAFSRHSKSGERFAAAERQADQQEATQLHAEEIDKVTVWMRTIAQNAGVALDLPGILSR